MQVTTVTHQRPAAAATASGTAAPVQRSIGGGSGNGAAVAGPLDRFHQRVLDKAADRSARPVVIVALGDSVTQGLAEVDTFLHDDVYHQRLKRKLEARFPLTTFSVINAGVDGQQATHGLERFQRDVVVHQPDLVLIAFGLNDAAYLGTSGLPVYAETVEAMILQARRQTSADVVLLTPNMMLARENDAVPECYAHLVPPCLRLQNTGVLARYAQRLREIGRAHGVAVADIYKAWEALAADGVDTTAMLSNGINHPNADGHELAAEELFNLIDELAPDSHGA